MTCQDKVAVVTGGVGRGTGRSIALTPAREGAKVCLHPREGEIKKQAAD